VIIADVAQENGSRVAKELGCDFHLTDVTKRDAWEALLNQTLDTHDKFDIAVNNAGGAYMNIIEWLAHFSGRMLTDDAAHWKSYKRRFRPGSESGHEVDLPVCYRHPSVHKEAWPKRCIRPDCLDC
jgi:NAD(P)-dependent dehydrogenase (short-subunit alcohol dehydrogenase family)